MSTAPVLLRMSAARVAFGAVEVLRGLDLEVRHGELVALVGPSGCGKTTVLNLASGWLTPEGGTVERPERVRMVFQQDGLFPWRTVRENVLLGLRHVPSPAERETRADGLLALVGLAGFAAHYPHQLSGGMRQRV
ncbi:MAG TPA: ATP-binding cassette domain-containing protein, partial [Vicinamibacteria bacterium]|nr:ATP-binding cassette domain-containing protein [Vicinamibacteria bacterium]